MAGATRRLHPKRLPSRVGKAWTGGRDLPDVPAHGFREWWQQREKNTERGKGEQQ
jgi:L-lactate dehydrogenase complex protein LldF